MDKHDEMGEKQQELRKALAELEALEQHRAAPDMKAMIDMAVAGKDTPLAYDGKRGLLQAKAERLKMEVDMGLEQLRREEAERNLATSMSQTASALAIAQAQATAAQQQVVWMQVCAFVAVLALLASIVTAFLR